MVPKRSVVSDTTPTYNVKAVAQRTGLTPTTIRTWERRYNLPTPQRGGQGYRLYSEYDIRTLVWLKAQLETGLSISRAGGQLVELRAAGRDPVALEPNSPPSLDLIKALTKPLSAGDHAPSLQVLDTHGLPYDLQNAWETVPVLLVFLRHFGCITCRELLGEFDQHRAAINASGLKLVFIGLADPEQAQQICSQLVPGALCLSNKTAEAYAVYGFKAGGLLQLAGPQVMSAVVRAAKGGYSQAETTGDIAMLGGLFIIDPSGFIRYSFYSRYAGDHPDLNNLLGKVGEYLQ